MNENNEYIEIKKDVYDKLLHDSNFLECLECRGVDNWSDYSDAVEMLEEYYGDAE